MIEPTIPSAEDIMLAREVNNVLGEHQAKGHKLRLFLTATGQDMIPIELPPIAAGLLIEILKQMAAGNAVSLICIPPEITVQHAAELLNVSRPFVLSLVDNGTLSAHIAGDQCRLSLSDVLAYKAKTRAQSDKAMNELAALDQELGLR